MPEFEERPDTEEETPSKRLPLPPTLHGYAFGSGLHDGISNISNATDGFQYVSTPLNFEAVYETLEACLNAELDQAKLPEEKSRVRALWNELDRNEAVRAIVVEHRKKFYSWKHDVELDPIHEMVINNEIEAIEALEHDQLFRHPTERRLAPMHLAADDGNENMVRALAIGGASPNALDSDGRSPLHLAAKGKWKAAMAALLAHGADPDTRDDDGRTALMLAAMIGCRDCATLLLPMCDLDAKDNDGQTAAALARENWPDLASELESFGRAQSERGLLDENLRSTRSEKVGGRTL